MMARSVVPGSRFLVPDSCSAFPVRFYLPGVQDLSLGFRWDSEFGSDLGFGIWPLGFDAEESISAFPQEPDQIRAPLQLQLVVHVVQVDLDGADADCKAGRDLLIVQAEGYEPDDFEFTRRHGVAELGLGRVALSEPL